MLRTALCALALAPLLALSACADASDAVSGDAAVARPASSLPSLPAFSVGPTGVIADVTADTCDADPGAVTAAGSATNSGKFARDLVVVVTWVVPDSGIEVARAIAELDDVGPGASADWSVDADVPEGASVACVPTAYAGQLA